MRNKPNEHCNLLDILDFGKFLKFKQCENVYIHKSNLKDKT